MKKLITALMILAALLCLTGCAHDTDTSNKFEGYYVVSVTMGGKPVNLGTLIIRGHTIEEWDLSYPDDFTKDTLNAMHQIKIGSGTINVFDDYFTIDDDPDRWYLEEDNGNTFLIIGDGIFDTLQKVDPGKTSPLWASEWSIDFYLDDDDVAIRQTTVHDEDGSLLYNFALDDFDDEDEWGFLKNLRPRDWKSEPAGGTFNLTFENVPIDVTLSENEATIIFYNTPYNFPKFVRATDWPAAQ